MAQDCSEPGSRRLNVALVHSFYGNASPSGENQAVLDQARALREAGHLVHTVAAHTDELQSRALHALRSGLAVATGTGRSPLARLRSLHPDVVHVHNLFPNFGRSWALDWDGPVVATVHNYRPMCAGGSLHRDGALCTRCPDGERWAGLRLGCYRDSRAATLPLAWANRRGAPADPLLRRADRLVMLSERSRDLYVRSGLPAHRIVLLPNFVAVPSRDRRTDTDDAPERRWLFVGRLSEEKGILPLLRRWPEREPLDVIGGGPLESACRAAAPAGVRLLGALGREQVLAVLPRYTGLVFPGTCPESAVPLVCQEALAHGLPVLALAGSAAADAVHRDGTGAVYSRTDHLPAVLADAGRRFPAMRSHCRRTQHRCHTPGSWAAAMVSVYEQAARHRQERQLCCEGLPRERGRR
jgi:glycosyltransferase involved in cell wall biosynthesis